MCVCVCICVYVCLVYACVCVCVMLLNFYCFLTTRFELETKHCLCEHITQVQSISVKFLCFFKCSLKPGNINDVDSVDQCSTSNLSDGEEWEDVISTGEVHKLRQQMEGLEMMYREILNMLGLDKEYIPGSRRSVSSLSSVGRGTRRSRSNAFSHRASREIRSVEKVKLFSTLLLAQKRFLFLGIKAEERPTF